MRLRQMITLAQPRQRKYPPRKPFTRQMGQRWFWNFFLLSWLGCLWACQSESQQLLTKGQRAKSQGRFQEAFILVDQALQAESVENWQSRADILFLQGEITEKLGRYESAENSFQAAGQIFSEHQLAARYSETLSKLGNIHLLWGNLDSGKELCQQALTIVADWPIMTERRDAEVAAHLCLGHRYWKTADYLLSRQEYDRVIALSGAGQDAHIYAKGLLGIALTLYESGNLEEAKAKLQEAQTIFQRENDSSNLAKVYINLGVLYFYQSRLAKDDASRTALLRRALKSYTQAKSYFLMSDMTDHGLLLSNIGYIYLQLQDQNQALNYFQSAIEMLKEIGFVPGLILTYKRLGDYYFYNDNPGKARETFTMVENLAALVQLPLDEMEAIYSQGYLYEYTEKNLPKALERYRKAVDILEENFLRQRLSKYKSSYINLNFGYYEALIALLVKMERWEDAFAAIESSKARSFLDMLSSKIDFTHFLSEATKADINTIMEKTSKYEYEIRKEVIKPQKLQEMPKVRTLQDQLAYSKQEFRKLMERIETGDSASPEIQKIQPVELSRLKKLIPADMTLLEYYPLNDALLIMVITPAGLQCRKIPIAKKDLETLAKSFDERIRTAESRDFSTLGQKLSEILLSPVLPLIPPQSRTLCVIPHGSLHLIPFQALYKEPGQFLIEAYNLLEIPSATFLTHIQQSKRPHVPLAVLALGDPLGDLKNAREEVSMMSRMYPATRIYLGQEATEVAFKKMAAANDVIHLACHGIFEKSKPILSYLDLAAGEGDDGKLMAWEIYTMKIQADLVFMSGCETALGDIDRGDNLLGLARSFLYAGAQSVIGTLWEVRETQALVDLIESFYRDLFAGKSKAEALRQAQIKMIRGEYPSCKQKEKNSCQHPYFWAPFILIGL